jgi:hypothetical protein
MCTTKACLALRLFKHTCTSPLALTRRARLFTFAGHTSPESRETCGVDSLACAIGNFCKCYAGFIAIDIESRLGCDKFK